MLESFLVNILFIILPILLINLFFDSTEKKYEQLIFLLFFAISMILCMNYPFKLEAGILYDLRYIPFTIVALYGGYKGLFPMYVLLNIQRFMIGGEGTFQSFLLATATFILLPLLTKRFQEYDSNKRVIVGVYSAVIGVLVYLLTLSLFLEKITSEFWTLAFYALIIKASFMMINLILIEKIISNKKHREYFLLAEQLHVMGELSASFSHELRNPLTATKGFLQLLAISKTKTDKDQLYIDYSLKEVMQAEKILNDYLAFSKPQSEHMIYSDLKEEIQYVKDMLQPVASLHNVEIRFHFSNSLKKNYDQNQIRQCLLNLLNNGIMSMKEKGGILSISVIEERKNIVIRIVDEGVGMTKEDLYHLGKPYYSFTKEGTGLGMVLVYGTIVKLNGNIDVQSKVGEGTTFTIAIPT
ncbi:sensor histidine kinase [Psychrobacillus lasiicapitis]|uniref:histidine kinase n=1 Tax=Psychrobacillus lasiicapitis TaxID=1636719 RepID=A0A544TB06_9BACI|nr:HAMP domain-containing sensor histidine kinase [Psychrobacillus lasiicapitis]TQR14576.1 HAMP domain-containing histidine kinase [Psychrobacillus lasiicapitis]GGA30234.1 sporulation kinase [Psychrobacillus lasiicapitis]